MLALAQVLNATPFDIIEDFDHDDGIWTEYDPNDKIELDYTIDHRLEFNNWIRTDPGYVAKSYPTQNFVVEYDINITADGGNANTIGPGFSDTLGTIDQIENGVYSVYYAGFGYPQIAIATRENGIPVWSWGPSGDNNIGISLNTTYYVRLEKFADTVTLSIFSDASRTTPIPGSPKTVTTSLSATNFNYFYAVDGYVHSPSNWEWTTGWIDNIKVGQSSSEPPSPPIPEPTTIVLMGFGLLGILGIAIRHRRKEK